MRIGYARVSTKDQSSALQLDALKKASCEKIFTETGSGAYQARPQLKAALEFLRPQDTLVVWRFDRLARNTAQLIETFQSLKDRSIGLLSLTEQIDTTGPGGALVFSIFAAIAQFERDIIRERTVAGLAAARLRGRTGGRPSKVTPEKIAIARQLATGGKFTKGQIASQIGVSETTLWRHSAKIVIPVSIDEDDVS